MPMYADCHISVFVCMHICVFVSVQHQYQIIASLPLIFKEKSAGMLAGLKHNFRKNTPTHAIL